MGETVLVHLLDEVPEHLLRDVEVGDDAVLERANRLDRARSAAEHALRFDPDGVYLAAPGIDRDHRRLAEDDAAAPHVDEGVGRTEVHGHVAAAEARKRVEEGHDRFLA